MNWALLNKQIKSCGLCDGLNSIQLGTQNAPGYGNTESRIVLIGQSLCGKPCIEAQVPFTGGSGKLLDDAFVKAGVKKEELYTTNVVKCHPPKNRKSKENEIENCTQYLRKELKWIRPKQIICLGKDAWAYFNRSIGSPCQKNVLMNGEMTTIHFVYHPSYIRRKPKHEREEYIDYIATVIRSGTA